MLRSKKGSSKETLASIKAEMNLPRIVKSARNGRSRLSVKRAEALLETHRLHLGLYRRVAERLGVDASYVSKVASGTRNCESVRMILLNELVALQ
jgi:transcriptional regulator with XRE-family HTH domain